MIKGILHKQRKPKSVLKTSFYFRPEIQKDLCFIIKIKIEAHP